MSLPSTFWPAIINLGHLISVSLSADSVVKLYLCCPESLEVCFKRLFSKNNVLNMYMKYVYLRSAIIIVCGERVGDHFMSISLFQKEYEKICSLMFRTFFIFHSLKCRVFRVLTYWKHRYLTNMLCEKQYQKTLRNNLFHLCC